MNNTILICPGKRAGMGALAERAPLAQIPVFGQTLVEYWLSHLACNGFKKVALLADDRTESLESLVQDGARWGMELDLISEGREFTPAEALFKYEKLIGSNPSSITVMEHFPGLPGFRLFDNPISFFHAIQAWMPHCHNPDRIGVRQLYPNVWAGLHARVSRSAQFHAPCWLGKGVYIGARAQIGPGAFIEDGSFIEPDTEIVDSYVGPDTLVGQGGAIKESLVWGNTLMNWKTGSVIEVPDAFILSGLRRQPTPAGPSWLERVSEICAPGKEEDLFIKDLLINKESSP
jgi:NDP-sugar pyrophosphorylase family protein